MGGRPELIMGSGVGLGVACRGTLSGGGQSRRKSEVAFAMAWITIKRTLGRFLTGRVEIEESHGVTIKIIYFMIE